MRNPKTLFYALLVRVAVGVYAFRKLGVRDPRLGLLGAILGLAGGVYLDRSRAERDLGDNIAFGLILSAILRIADILYGISMLTPKARKLGLITLSLTAMGSALAAEKSVGRPGKVPVLGILAIVVAFLLVFSAVHTTTISKKTRYSGGTLGGGGYDGFQGYYNVYNTSNEAKDLIRLNLPNATSYTLALSKPGYDKLRNVGVPIRTNRSTLQLNAGDVIEITLQFSQNVSQPLVRAIYYLPDGSKIFQKILSENGSKTLSELTTNFTVQNTIKLARALYVYLDRTPLGPSGYPNLPLTISISRALVGYKDVSKLYLSGAMALLVIAIIDALPLESKPKVTRKKRKKARR